MTSSPIISWQIDGETMETVTDFIFSGSKITADGDCSHEIKRHLLLARKAMTNLDSILKSRDITLPTKIRLVKAMVFPVVMYGCESWADYKESWALKNWCFWSVVLEKTLQSLHFLTGRLLSHRGLELYSREHRALHCHHPRNRSSRARTQAAPTHSLLPHLLRLSGLMQWKGFKRT